MKVFVGCELLTQQSGTPHGPAGINDQAAIGFVVEKRLSDSKHKQRIKPATHNCEHQSGHDRTANFSEEVFHDLNKFEGRNNDIDQFDADKWNDDAAQAVDEEVAPQHGHCSDRLELNATQRQRNQGDDNQRIENDGA